ncbi:MAG: PHP domain-containing protein [Methanotrichaceae archaeon]|nr:PHP domain-containing protein [Methanotrichaceae archaeon]
MRFDLHVHSIYSDGHDEVKAILEAALMKGLGGISITDHDTLKGSLAAEKLIRECKMDLVLLPGVEVTTSEGHLIVLGAEELPPKGRSPEETTDLAHDMGAVAVVPHPYHPFRHALGRIPGCDAVEVYNSKHLFGIANARARLEASRRNMPMVAGSDSHFAATVGLGVTEIEADDAEEAIRAIREGRTAIEGHRTSPKYFIGNTFQAIYREIGRGMRRI